MRKIASSIVLAVYACCSPMAYAQYEPQIGVDVSVGGGVSTNPFLYADGKTAASANIDIAPYVVVEDELGATRINGNLRFTQYSKFYGNDVSARIEAATERRLDERNTVRVAASAQRLRSAIQDGLIFESGGGSQGPGPLLPPTVPIIDTTLAGTRARITSLSTSFGLSHILNERSSLDAGIELNGTYIDEGAGFDYRSVSSHAGYRRQLTQRTTVTFDTQLGFVDYLSRRTGDSMIVSPRVGIQQQLTNRLSVVADAGISYVRTDVGGGDRSNLVSFAGSVGLCDRGPNRTLCLSGGRSAQPTALGGVSTVTTASLNYNAQLSRIDRVSMSARYGRTNQDGAGLPVVRVTDFIGVSATYARDLNDRLAFTVTPGYSKIFDDTQRRSANYSLMVGLTMKFGKRR